jgi:hypothetical protein
MESQREVIEGKVDSSELLHSGAELEQASHIAGSAHKGRAASGAAFESPSKIQQDARNSPDNITTNDLQHEPHDSPDVNSGKEAGEHIDPTECHEDILRGVTNNAPEPGPSAGEGQEVAQLHNHDMGEGDEGGKGDKELGEEHAEQMEQTEGDSENDARYSAGANGGGAEGFGTRVMKQNLKQDEEELQQHDLKENRLSSSATLGGGINDTLGGLALEDLDSTQGHMNRSGTLAVTTLSSDVASTLEQETRHETEPGQVTSNDRVDYNANTSKEQREHSNVTTRRKVHTAGA